MRSVTAILCKLVCLTTIAVALSGGFGVSAETAFSEPNTNIQRNIYTASQSDSTLPWYFRLPFGLGIEFGMGAGFLDHGPSEGSLTAGGFPADVGAAVLVSGSIDVLWGGNIVSPAWRTDFGSIDRNDLFRLETDIETVALRYGRLVDVGPSWFQLIPRGSVGYGFTYVEAVSGPDDDRRLDARIKADGMVYELGIQLRLCLPEFSTGGRLYLAISYDYRFATLDIGDRFRSELNIPSKFIFDEQDQVDFSGHLIALSFGVFGTGHGGGERKGR